MRRVIVCGFAILATTVSCTDGNTEDKLNVVRLDSGEDSASDGSTPILDGTVTDAQLLDATAPDAMPDASTPTPVHERKQSHSSTLLFDPAKDEFNISYHSFRIPALARTKSGTLLAFAEGRQCSRVDEGNINLVYKRSTDHGKTWSSLKEVVGAGPGVWGNPTPVVDLDTGTIWLFMTWNDEDVGLHAGTNPCTGKATHAVQAGERPVFLTKSTDDGKTWSKPVDMTATLQPEGMKWDAMGPGIGIQTTVGNPGRLIAPSTKRNIYSDDHGKTWKMARVPNGTGEGAIVELSDGRLMRNDRATGSVWPDVKRRMVSVGTLEDGFAAFAGHKELLDPRCQASTLRYSSDINRILFLNPASTEARCKMRVRISYDDGKTWPVSRRIHENMTEAETCSSYRGGYSSMIKTADYQVGALVERGNAVRSIEFHRFNLPWIVNGTPEPLP